DVRAACTHRFGLAGGRLILAATHTHTGPCVRQHLGINEPPDAAYMAWLRSRLVEVVGRALADREPATLSYRRGEIAQLGWNRRGLRHDGTAQLYYGSWYEDFAGVQGTR